jgi:hypothetical protein
VQVKGHAKERYCERVLGIAPENIKAYLAENGHQVEQQILAMLNQAELIMTKEHTDYLLKDNILLVVVEKSAIVTVVKCDYGFDEEINLQIIQQLKIKLKEKQQALERITESYEKRLAEITTSMGKVELKIRHLESRVREKQALHRQLKAQAESVDAELDVLRKEIEQYQHQLVYSTAFKMEELRTKKRA